MKYICLVTGANKGLGLAAVRLLAQENIVILTSRSEEKGRHAVSLLEKEGLSVEYHQLDVTNEQSIQRAYEFVTQKFGRLDVLVNNAGILYEKGTLETPVDDLRRTMETNIYGSFRLCQLFLPLMQKHNYGRIVNISSGMGQLSEMDGGYSAYRISKTALNAVTKIFAVEGKDTNILVNSVSPGWCKTDMGGPRAPRSPEEGAETIVWAALLPNNGPTGKFFHDKKEILW